MKILALEFSSPQRSVALVDRGESAAAALEYEVVETGPGSNQPFEMIAEVLRKSATEREQVERLVVGLGPGSYAGIRAGIALAQGWQLGLDTPIQGVSSAEAVAAQAHAEGLTGPVAVIIDAQRGEFYLAAYELSPAGWCETEPLRLASPEDVKDHEKSGRRLVGPEAGQWFSNAKNIFPRAAILGRLALNQSGFIPGETLQPIYLRTTTFVKAPPPRILPD